MNSRWKSTRATLTLAVLSVLLVEGLECLAYSVKFKALPLDDFPDLDYLCSAGISRVVDQILILT